MQPIHSQIEQLSINREQPGSGISRSYYIIGLICLLAIIFLLLLINQTRSAELDMELPQLTHKQQGNKQNLTAIAPLKESVATPLVDKKTSILDASGHIVARRIATVSSRVTGKITRLNIEEGQKVARNEILAELDNRQAKISYQLAMAELNASQAVYDELMIRYEHESRLNQRRELLAENKLISDELLETSQNKTRQMAAQIKNKLAQIELTKQRLALAQYQLDQHKVRAPFDAIVISKNAQIGELISAGSSAGGFIRTGVGTIVDMGSLEIEVEVGESYINRVYSGQAVEARLDAYPDWHIKSQVVTIIPTADRQKATIKVRVKLLESDPRILPDMGVKVSFLQAVGG